MVGVPDNLNFVWFPCSAGSGSVLLLDSRWGRRSLGEGEYGYCSSCGYWHELESLCVVENAPFGREG